MENPKAFVSYAREQADLARRVSEELRRVGIEAFFADWEIAYGDDFVKKLNDGLSGASFFVLLVSPDFLRKGWPMAEQSAATVRMVEDRARVIPVNLGVPAAGFPPLIRILRWIPGENGDAKDIASRISAAILGSTPRPPVGPLPKFLDRSLDLSYFPSLTTADKSVLRLVFELGAENLFRADFEALRGVAQAAGIDQVTIKESLDALEEQYLLKVERYTGGIHSVVLTTSGAEECCSEILPDYARRKREILAAIVNSTEEHSTNSDAIAERTREPAWLVCHVLRDAERRGDIRIHHVFVGHEYYSIDSVSSKLKRSLHQQDTER